MWLKVYEKYLLFISNVIRMFGLKMNLLSEVQKLMILVPKGQLRFDRWLPIWPVEAVAKVAKDIRAILANMI